MLKQILKAILHLFSKPAQSEDKPALLDYGWMKKAKAEIGIKEFPGEPANPLIMKAWQYVDYDPPEGDETAWCSAKMNQWMFEAGIPGTRLPNARSWEKWGKEIKTPVEGCVVVLWRGSPRSWQGHVGIYVGKGKPGYIKILGGNQGDEVNISEFPEARVVGYRMPVSMTNSRTLSASMVGTAGAAVSIISILASGFQELMQVGAEFKAMGEFWRPASLLGSLVIILAFLVVIYARKDDLINKGR